MTIDNPDEPIDAPSSSAAELRAQLSSDLETATEHAKDDIGAITERAKEDVRALGQEAGAKVSQATDQVKSFAADQKTFAAGQINGVAAAINKVADELDGSDQQTIARYARDLASGLSTMGSTVQDRDVDDLMGLAQDFGRKQPVAFLGAAALAGFVASRFALASSHRREQKASAATSQHSQTSGYAAGSGAASANLGGE